MAIQISCDGESSNGDTAMFRWLPGTDIVSLRAQGMWRFDLDVWHE
ncbi:MAG: hypothetical protein NT013_25055 [Planctomycetia bacterium]|nr:hypothetical protein [Planctomycetia bacterium]